MVKIQWSYNDAIWFGTRDAIIAQHSIISKKKKTNEIIFCKNIYFKKAFDRRLLCLNFSKVAIEGKSLEVIKAFYRHVKFCIGVEGFFSEYFFDNLGLMQGEMLSPIPFNLYVNDFENSFLNACCFFYELSS